MRQTLNLSVRHARWFQLLSSTGLWPKLGFWLPIVPASATPGWTEHGDRVRHGIMKRVGPRRKAECEEQRGNERTDTAIAEGELLAYPSDDEDEERQRDE